MKTLSETLFLISIFCLGLYNYLDNLNDLTRMRLSVPAIRMTLNTQQIEFHQLQDEWTHISRPQVLYELREKNGFRHLREYKTPLPFPKKPS